MPDASGTQRSQPLNEVRTCGVVRKGLSRKKGWFLKPDTRGVSTIVGFVRHATSDHEQRRYFLAYEISRFRQGRQMVRDCHRFRQRRPPRCIEVSESLI
jgi:hypothetical protein